jgi:amidase
MTEFTRRQACGLLGCGLALPLTGSCGSDSRSPDRSLPTATGDGATPLHFLSLRDVARLVESRELSPVELTRALLDRIEATDGGLKSYATVMSEQAMVAARTAEREIQGGTYRGVLHGVPVAVKDLCYTTGVRTMGGMAVRADFVPDHDATVVSRLEAAGVVLLGKLNLTEGALGSYHPDFDRPINPWGETFWAGVSSSGSGVATAAGLCFGALGTDTGGSIRFPSMANGIVGFKPTYGRISRYGVLPLSESFDHVGPMARRVADAAVLFEAIAGVDPNDPTSLDLPGSRLLETLDRGVDGLRIGVDRHYLITDVDAGLVSAIDQALDVLDGLGARVVEVEMPDMSANMGAWSAICSFEAARGHAETFPVRTDEYGPGLGSFLEGGARVTDSAYEAALAVRAVFSAQYAAMLSTVDAFACPSGGVAFDISVEDDGAVGRGLPFTVPANLAGTPTISVPCGFSPQGAPYGIQFVGRHLSEAMLCRVAHAYEQETDWHTRHPAV